MPGGFASTRHPRRLPGRHRGLTDRVPPSTCQGRRTGHRRVRVRGPRLRGIPGHAGAQREPDGADGLPASAPARSTPGRSSSPLFLSPSPQPGSSSTGGGRRTGPR